MIIRMLTTLLFAVGTLFGSALAADAPVTTDPVEVAAADSAEAGDFFSTITANPELSMFAQAFQRTAINEEIDVDQEWTIFAPSDSVTVFEVDLATREVVSAYIVRGAYTYDELWQMAQDQGGMTTLETLGSGEISLEIVDDDLLIAGSAQITTQDIEALNGYIHVINGLIDPAPVD